MAQTSVFIRYTQLMFAATFQHFLCSRRSVLRGLYNCMSSLHPHIGGSCECIPLFTRENDWGLVFPDGTILARSLYFLSHTEVEEMFTILDKKKIRIKAMVGRRSHEYLSLNGPFLHFLSTWALCLRRLPSLFHVLDLMNNSIACSSC